MKTAMLLMVRYDGLAVIPVEDVCRDYFQHLSADKFIRKVSGHRSWSSLQRYAQIKQAGDKFKDWKWLETVTK